MIGSAQRPRKGARAALDLNEAARRPPEVLSGSGP